MNGNGNLKEDTEINQGIDLTKQGDKEFYTLRQIDGGVWRYEKQFDYYTLTSPSGAVLSKYNDLYSVTNLTLPGTISSGEYVNVDKTKYENYFSAGTKVKLTFDNLNSEEGARFAYFFPSKWQELKNGNGTPTEVEASLSEIDHNKRGAYYSEYSGEWKKGTTKFLGKVTTEGGNYTYQPAYTVVEAEEPIGGTAGGVNVIYILQAIGQNEVPGGYRKDANGFVYSVLTGSFDLIGIGKEAFKGVTNAKTLSLPNTLLYIGDSAFANSYVEKITLTNVKDIGNYAFKESRLQQVEFTTANTKIGTEAFYGTRLTNVNFPYSINTIGAGAFANNAQLTAVSFDSTSPTNIKDFAFYDCTSLGSLDLTNQNITSIGKGAFALGKVDEGKMISFKLPKGITTVQSTTSTTGLGDYVFYGRTELKEVTMPGNLGYTSAVALPANLFLNCTGLSYVEFPDTCRFTTFPATMFTTVTNPDFYVKGPKYDAGNQPAGPRKSTWACKMSGEAYVPYVFEENGQKYYEVSDGNYLLLVDHSGKLLS
ncbi:MAG: leucine-rich repeat domain-containing protein, partial [Lachnospiraceae bacterium]|nr:leucine-rich repeat domain-containing protein [Lachnospiraceae bacterium]